ncbi:MAG: galactose oxidase-like domain-containing protein [Planctomycetota bacterium]
MRRALVPAVLVLPALLTAQSLVPFGAGCGTSGARLEPYGAPVPGQTLELHLRDAAPGAPHFVLIGFSSTSWSGTPLPLAIPTALGFAPGCTLFVSLELWPMVVAGANGEAVVQLAIPAGVSGTLHVQGLGLPATGPAYTTAAWTVSIAPAAPTTVAGTVQFAATSAPLANARVTVFTPALSTFREARSGATGGLSSNVLPGRYRAGCALREHEYIESDVVVPIAGATLPFALAPETHQGQWRVIGNTLPETLDATDIGVLLADGRLFYCHDTTDPIVFDPATGQKTFPGPSGSEQGCMNGTLLEDARVILVGGQDGASPGSFTNATRRVKAWSAATGWQGLPWLLNPTGRWYPGLARLADGRLLIMGGGTAPAAVRTPTCEIYDPVTNTWSWTGTMGQAVEFPPSALLLTGRVLRTWGAPELYDPATGTWTPTGGFTAPNRGWPGHSDHSLCVLHDGRAIVVGITQLAGAQAPMVERYDPATASWTARSSPSLKRSQCEVVPLPDGRVLVQGGDVQNQATAEPTLFGVVKRTDLYAPDTDIWRRVANTFRFREYHAVTLLLPDGRVATTGGTNIKFQGTPLSADIDAWSPPYLFRGVRPTIASLVPPTLQRGSVVTFDVTPATAITNVVLMGTGATTHWVDGGVPRRLVLPVQQTGSQVTVTLPANANVLPLGHYLLFAMVDDIPSVARIVRVQP